jgi:hypothetical protein
MVQALNMQVIEDMDEAERITLNDNSTSNRPFLNVMSIEIMNDMGSCAFLFWGAWYI